MATNEQEIRRLEFERSNKEALARELEAKRDAASQREAERQRQYAAGIAAELAHLRSQQR